MVFTSPPSRCNSSICKVWLEAVRLCFMRFVFVSRVFWEEKMSINGHANTDLYSECTAGDTEGNESTPLLTNVSTENRTVTSHSQEISCEISELQRYSIRSFLHVHVDNLSAEMWVMTDITCFENQHISSSLSAFSLCQHLQESPFKWEQDIQFTHYAWSHSPSL